jgi:UDP-N-acetylglucosamine--N-acetylmuramyl-(pentapeptide) pyrophosphoryl-undecaprenol N-acetylglucosamine transferase
MKIIFAGGGSGGHIFPILAITRELKELKSKGSFQEDLKLFYLGPKDYFAQLLLSQEEIKFQSVLAGKIRRYFSAQSIIQNIFDILIKIPLGIIQSFFHIFLISPDIIFSKGGYGSWPVVIAAWFLGVPIFLHESDITPGLANKIISRFSLIIFTSFPKTEYFPLKKVVLTGNPIRREILEGSKEEAQIRFKLNGQKPVILVLGGSQGAQRINDLILNILPELLDNYEIIHQCGDKNIAGAKAEANVIINEEQAKLYHLYPFLDEIELSHAYQAADLITSRAGSGSIFEIAALGKPSILVPLPESAQNHQLKNAFTFAQDGRALVIEEENLTPNFFIDRLKYLFSHPRETAEMARKAKDFSQPQAALLITKYLLDYLSS